MYFSLFVFPQRQWKNMMSQLRNQAKCVLVVDDHEEWQALLQMLLTEHHYRVLLTDGKAQALEVASQKPDFVLLGLRGGADRNLELAQKLRQLFNPQAVPIFLIAHSFFESPTDQAGLINGYFKRETLITDLIDTLQFLFPS